MPDERRQERYFDTHADEESGMRSTKLLYEAVIENNPDCNAYATFGSNFLEGEPTPYQTKNSYNRVRVEVSGAARLAGLDNGDSMDYD